MPLIEASGIGKRYGPTATALHPASLRIGKGEFVAIVGPSGSGKSTLMSLLGLLDCPTSGLLVFEGTDCSRLSDAQRARLRNRHIGFVFQSYYLLPRLTAVANVELPLVYAGMHARERRGHAERALAAVGLAGKNDRLPTELSGGEQQRVAIARAIVCEPSIVLADEPTGALDTASGRAILDILKSINRSGRTVVMVTHDPGIAGEASRKLCMRDGWLISDSVAGPEPAPGLYHEAVP